MPLLLVAVDDDSPNVQGEALQALALLGPRAEPALPKMEAILECRDDPRWFEEMQVVGTIGPGARQCAEFLKAPAENDPDANVRRRAAWALNEVRR